MSFYSYFYSRYVPDIMKTCITDFVHVTFDVFSTFATEKFLYLGVFFLYRLHKVIRDITKYLQTTEKGPWSQSRVLALDRALGEIGRILDKKVCAVE